MTMTPTPGLPPFTDQKRFEFPLTPESVIVEAGTHKGQWCALMAERYGCRIFTFEPILEFYGEAATRLAQFGGVVISQCGLASESRIETWHIKGDMTGQHVAEGKEEEVILIDFPAWLRAMEQALPPVIDLLEINIEGGEYELLECLIALGLTTRFKNILVQFHGVGLTPVERRRGIQESLAKTHHLTFDAPFIWENWELNQ